VLAKDGIRKSVTICNQLKLQSDDGKFYKTDVGNVKDIFRLIQSISVNAKTKTLSIRIWLWSGRN
jgi:hypothetical protein